MEGSKAFALNHRIAPIPWENFLGLAIIDAVFQNMSPPGSGDPAPIVTLHTAMERALQPRRLA